MEDNMKLKLLKYTLFFILVVVTVTVTSHGVVYAFSVGEEKSIGLYYTLLDSLGLQEQPSQLSYERMIELTAKQYEVPPQLALAIAVVESNIDPEAISPKGATGIMQVMPMHVKTCGLDSRQDLFNARKNIECGIIVLKDALNNRSVTDALCMYNSGRMCSDRSPQETKQYVGKVLNNVRWE